MFCWLSAMLAGLLGNVAGLVVGVTKIEGVGGIGIKKAIDRIIRFVLLEVLGREVAYHIEIS